MGLLVVVQSQQQIRGHKLVSELFGMGAAGIVP